MGGKNLHQPGSAGIWTLAEHQHGVLTRRQLLELGFSSKAIERRISNGRLHRVVQGVYAVGRPKLTLHGRWMAAVLSCGPAAALSHETAAALWGIRSVSGPLIHVLVPRLVVRSRPGIVVHRRQELAAGEVTRCHRIPVTNPICTLVDLAVRLNLPELEAAINEADKRDLIDPEELRAAIEQLPRRRGIPALRRLLDRSTFRLTDSDLERRFLPLTRQANLPPPQTGRYVSGHKVDFYWPELGLVVETDGLRYHRTPAQQARDRSRDQAIAVADLTPLRFTHAQVRFEPNHVVATLSSVAGRLRHRG